MPDPFGSFNWICLHTPSPQCNLFFAQYWNQPSPPLTRVFPSNSSLFELYDVTGSDFVDDPNVMAARDAAGTGIGGDCQIPRVGTRGSFGDIALIVLSAVAILVTAFLAWRGNRRKAAVGRVELRTLLIFFMVHCVFQILTMSSLFVQGTLALSVLTALHLAIIAAGYWILLVNAIVATQFVEDGTAASIVPMCLIGLLIFAPTLYIALDTSQSWTSAFNLGPQIRSTALLVLTLIWPAIAAVTFGLLMVYVSFFLLKEIKPAVLYLVAGLLFAGGQIIFYLASEPLCRVSDRKINGSFLTTLLHLASIVTMYFAWESITEASWGEDYTYGGAGVGGPYYT